GPAHRAYRLSMLPNVRAAGAASRWIGADGPDFARRFRLPIGDGPRVSPLAARVASRPGRGYGSEHGQRTRSPGAARGLEHPGGARADARRAVPYPRVADPLGDPGDDRPRPGRLPVRLARH